MDPDAALKALDDAMANGDRDGVFEYADALIGWIERGGFMPSLVLTIDWRHGLERNQILEHLRALRAMARMK